MSASSLLRLSLASLLVAGTIGTAIAQAVSCCKFNLTWENGGDEDCHGSSTTYCEQSTSNGNGKYYGSVRAARCYTSSPSSGNFVRTDCEHQPGTGYEKVGPPLADGSCCWAFAPQTTSWDREDVNIVDCVGPVCPPPEPWE